MFVAPPPKNVHFLLFTVLVFAEWAPAGPTVCTGRSSKKFQKKYRSQQKDHRPRGEKTGVRMLCKQWPSNKPILSFCCMPLQKKSSEKKIGEKPKYRLHPDSGQVSLRAQLNSKQAKNRCRLHFGATQGWPLEEKKKGRVWGWWGCGAFYFLLPLPPCIFLTRQKKW